MRKAVFFAALAAAVSLVTAGVALSAHDVPGTVTPSLIPKEQANACDGGFKIEDPSSGLYVFTIDGGAATVHLQITVVDTANGPTFTFQSLSGEVITSISVKGGPGGANLYSYGAGIAHDDGLHSPLNANNGKWYGLSHLCVAADKL